MKKFAALFGALLRFTAKQKSTIRMIAVFEKFFSKSHSLPRHISVLNYLSSLSSLVPVARRALPLSILMILTAHGTGNAGASPVSATAPFQQDGAGQGLVSIEAENYHGNTSAPDGHEWVATAKPGFSGTGAMEALPEDRVTRTTNYAASSPRLDYQVEFVTTGKHYVWIRGLASGYGSDSVHIGLDGVEVSTSRGIGIPVGSGYGWSNGKRTINVGSPGVHTLNIWMRESGAVFDKVVVSADPNFVPTGAGPQESPKGKLPTPAISPKGGTFVDSVTVTLETDTPDAVIYYTLDESDPTPNSTLYSSPFPLTSNATIKVRAFLGGYMESELASADFTITVNEDTGSTEPFKQDNGAQGLVSIEAENYHGNTSAPDGHEWVATAKLGFSGTGAMEALPEDRVTRTTNYAASSPRLDYQVEFVTTGKHYVWIRGLASGYGSDSVHIGLDGVEVSTSGGIGIPVGSGYGWSNGKRTINVGSPGVHTLNIWMRESGAVFDKVVLTSDSGFIPTGMGSSESPRGSGDTPDGSDNPPTNSMPIARADIATTNENTSVDINVLANDRGLDDGPLVLTVVQAPSHGTSAIQPDNRVAYTPKADYVGQDTLAYKVTDTDGDSAIATVAIQIDCPDCATDVRLGLTWNPNPEPVLGYTVYYGPTPETALQQVSDLSVDSGLFDLQAPAVEYNAANDLELRRGDQICFRVRAYNSIDLSHFSEAVCAEI